MAEKVACVLVQYVVLRGDLLRVDKWPIGAIVAQACHASTAVLHQFKDDPNTQQYLKDLDHMRKVVLEAKDQAELVGIANALQTDKIDFKLWTEQPENIPTCLATRPYDKSVIQKYFKKLKLFK